MSIRFFPHRAAVMESHGPPPPLDTPDTPEEFPSDPVPHEPIEGDVGEVRERPQRTADEASLA